MVILHPLSDFIDSTLAVSNLSVNYYYEGRCPESGRLLKLPRTPLVEAIANGLMQHLANHNSYSREGKMYGVLLVELPEGEQRVIKAFSGLLFGSSVVEGWVPPIPGRDQVALEESRTLVQLEALKQELIALKQLPQRQQYEVLLSEFEQQLQTINFRHQDCQRQRQEKRQIFGQTMRDEALAAALEELDSESRQQGIERRQFKRQRDNFLQPLQQLIAAADLRMREIKQQRKELSRQLQAQMHAAYNLTNFLGKSLSLQQLMGGSLPTGTGDCCAPKLLHYAAVNGLKPLAMAEFWWGLPTVNQDKIQGNFYGACAERCQPLMGFLLSGLPKLRQGEGNNQFDADAELPILYEDEWLVAVNKSAGLLSVPGRYCDRQDSVLSRLRHLLLDGMALMAVHRLDQETSGILLLARDRQTYRLMSQQFQERTVEKVYEAVLAGVVATDEGAIALPLWGDPENRPYQQVDEVRGKASLTRFRVMRREGESTRVEFRPVTGRTHQIRVHAADVRGMGIPILGDRLYGSSAGSRLHLHARELRCEHPHLGGTLHLETVTPF